MRILTIVRDHRRAWAALSLGYYGLGLVGIAVVAANPGFETWLRDSVRANVSADLVGAYAAGDVPRAAWLTFVNNLLLASLVAITLPSLAIPFWGVVLGAGRGLLWGLAQSPTDPGYTATFTGQLPTWILEGQGYVLAMLGAYLLWRRVLLTNPSAGRWASYLAGIREVAILYAAIIPVLAVAAVYEALASIYLVPPG
jgi:hypothetical protein